MKIIILGIFMVITLGTGVLWADEIVLENGEILSGEVIDLTETTVSVRVDGKPCVLDRGRVHAVFLGEDTPFSTKGYPGLQSMEPAQTEARDNEKED